MGLPGSETGSAILPPPTPERPMSSVQFVDFAGKTKLNGESIEALEAELQRVFEKVVDARAGADSSFEQREAAALALANDVTKQHLENDLKRIEAGFDETILIDGVPYKRSHEPTPGRYPSLCGALEVPRSLYREVGKRNGPTVVPLELAAGLVEGVTPALAYSIALDYTKQTSREYVESMAASHRRPPSRSTVERIARQLGTKARAWAPSIERYLRPGEGVEEGAVAISVGLDRTSVPYEEVRPEGAPPATRRKERKKPYVRTPPPPVDTKYRMDYVGTVSLVDADGDKLVTRKYTATHEEGCAGILKRMMADIRGWKGKSRDLVVGIVQDGAPELWNALRGALRAEPSVGTWLEAIDRFHLSERLGQVLKLTEPTPEAAKSQLERWEAELDEDDGTIDRIKAHLDNRLWWWRPNTEVPEELTGALTYIKNNNDRMRYVELRKCGLPVGSGITEGACKSLPGTRVKRSGQRWHTEGVSAVLTLRAIHQSERLPRFWKHVNRRYTAKIERLAA